MHSEISLIVLPVFLVITLGFSLKKTGLMTKEFVYDLNRLIYYIALPSLLFYKIATADFSANFNSDLLGGLVVATIFVFILSYGYASTRGYQPAVKGAFVQGSARGNLAYIGLAIIHSAFGEEGFTKAGILLGFMVPLFNLLSIIGLVLPHRRESLSLGRMYWIRQVLQNPLIIASFAGVFWSYLQLPIPQIIDRSLGIITGMSLPLALFSIGASFSFKKLKGDIVVTLIATLIKIVLLPLVAGCMLFWFGVRGDELAIGMLLAGTPTATAAYIMAQQLKGDAELSGAIIMLSTLCSMATFSLMLYLLQYLGI